MLLPTYWRQIGTRAIQLAISISKRYGWQFEQGRMPDGSGWLFKRAS